MDIYLTILAIIMLGVVIGILCYVYIKYRLQIHDELDDLRILMHEEARIDTPFYVYSEPVSSDVNGDAKDVEK